MPLPLIGTILLAIQVYFAIHAARRGRREWMNFVLFVPVIGWVVYLFAEYIPQQRRLHRGAFNWVPSVETILILLVVGFVALEVSALLLLRIIPGPAGLFAAGICSLLITYTVYQRFFARNTPVAIKFGARFTQDLDPDLRDCVDKCQVLGRNIAWLNEKLPINVDFLLENLEQLQVKVGYLGRILTTRRQERNRLDSVELGMRREACLRLVENEQNLTRREEYHNTLQDLDQKSERLVQLEQMEADTIRDMEQIYRFLRNTERNLTELYRIHGDLNMTEMHRRLEEIRLEMKLLLDHVNRFRTISEGF